MYLPDEDFAQANFKFSGAGVPLGAECTLGFDISGSSDTLTGMAGTLATLWEDTIGTQQTAVVGLSSVAMKAGPNETGESVEVAGGGASGVGSSSTPSNYSVLVRKRTAFGGRQGRGRMFIPGLAESVVDSGGHIDAGALGGYQAALDDFLASCTSAFLIPQVLHTTAEPTPYPITNFIAMPVGATQRRRLRR